MDNRGTPAPSNSHIRLSKKQKKTEAENGVDESNRGAEIEYDRQLNVAILESLKSCHNSSGSSSDAHALRTVTGLAREYDLLKEGVTGTESEAAEAYEAERRKKGKTVAHESESEINSEDDAANEAERRKKGKTVAQEGESEINSEDDAEDKGKGKAIVKDKKQDLTGIREVDELEQDVENLQQRIINVEALYFKIRDRGLKQKANVADQRWKGKTIAHEIPEEIEIDAPIESDTDSSDDAVA